MLSYIITLFLSQSVVCMRICMYMRARVRSLVVQLAQSHSQLDPQEGKGKGSGDIHALKPFPELAEPRIGTNVPRRTRGGV